MELEIYLYSFAKKANSTKQVSGDGTQVHVVWNQPYNDVSPTIKVRGTSLAGYNYCYIPQFGRYYWINWLDRYRNEDECVVNCECDVLATYKPYLMQQSFYVELSESNYNPLYPDARVGMLATTQKASNSVKMPGISTESLNYYYLEAVGTGDNGSFTNKYIVLPDNMGILAQRALTDPEIIKGIFDGYGALASADQTWFNKLLDSPLLNVVRKLKGVAEDQGLDEEQVKSVIGNTLSNMANSWDAVVSAVQERFKNPWDCIVSLKGLAISNANIFGTSPLSTIKLGVTDSEVAARVLLDTLSTVQSCTVAIPWRYGDFRNLDPYTQVNVIMPNCSVAKLPAASLYGETVITAKYRINATSGEVAGYLETGSGIKVSDFSFNISTSISLAAANDQNLGGLNTVLEAGKTTIGIASGNVELGAQGFCELVTPDKYTVSVKGNTNTCTLLDDNMRVEVIANNTQNPSTLTKIGRPCRQTLPLSSLSGYTKCLYASADIPATKREIDAVNSYLNGGFYIE